MEIRRIQVEGPDGDYGLSYADWGSPDAARTIICVHGLTRNGRDFDHLATVLQDHARVICPDMVGRGLSDPLRDPEQYALPTYVAHMLQLLDKLGLAEVDWVGTSMGGLIGMGVAASGARSAGWCSTTSARSSRRPHSSVSTCIWGCRSALPVSTALEAHLREIHAGFGPLTDAEWRHLAEHSASRREDGTFRLSYDQRLAEPMKRGPIADIDLWPVWDQIRCPVLVLRGTQSELLLAATAEEMTRRGPGAEVVEIDGTGHAPALMAKDQIAIVRDWLLR